MAGAEFGLILFSTAVSLSWPGATALGAFYAVFLFVGMWVGRNKADTAHSLMLANRELPLWLAVLTLIATWVGGGYINGSAEGVYDAARGLVWTQAPWCYALSLVLGGILFAGRMRQLGLTTMLDLFERRYGAQVAALLFIPGVLADIFWMAAILCALGTTCSAVIGMSPVHGVWISAAVAVAYTIRGGLWSVAYTDALQLVCLVVGLGVALPFVAKACGGWDLAWSEYQETFAATAHFWPDPGAWRGSKPWGWQWLDAALLLILGGIPWQVYFQRVLASRTPKSAVILSILAGVGCLLMAVPPVCLGVFGATTDWSTMSSGPPETAAMILPYVLRYLTPGWIAIVGLAAVAAAVMSSMDSSLLSVASQFTWNVYRPMRGRAVTDFELRWLMRGGVLFAGVFATALALVTQSVYTLWFLCADLVYVILFPQLVASLYFRRANAYGAIAGVVVGTLLRAMGGEMSLGISCWDGFPWLDGQGSTLFPFRTMAAAGSGMAIVIVSLMTQRWSKPRSLTVTVAAMPHATAPHETA